MKKAYFDYDANAEEYGLDINMSVSFYSTEDGKRMQLCSCTLSYGTRSCDYAWVIGETTLEDVINEFLKGFKPFLKLANGGYKPACNSE